MMPRGPLATGRRFMAAVCLVVVMVASMLFVKPAGAEVREFRWAINSNIHSFDVRVLHDRSTGWFTTDVWRYTKGFGAYLGHELHEVMPDWGCVYLEDRSGSQSDILHIWTNYPGDSQPQQPCFETQVIGGPPSPGHAPWSVETEGGGFSAYDEPYAWSFKWAGPMGSYAFGYYAPLYGAFGQRYHALI